MFKVRRYNLAFFFSVKYWEHIFVIHLQAIEFFLDKQNIINIFHFKDAEKIAVYFILFFIFYHVCSESIPSIEMGAPQQRFDFSYEILIWKKKGGNILHSFKSNFVPSNWKIGFS